MGDQEAVNRLPPVHHPPLASARNAGKTRQSRGMRPRIAVLGYDAVGLIAAGPAPLNK
jgi:hypothetical protein